MWTKNEQTERTSRDFSQEFLDQTGTAKRMFIRLYEAAKAKKNKKIMEFCLDVLNLYDKHGINGHIEWER